MAEQENAETIIFLPWTVESQLQTQAVILQQPSETHLRLDATTDKTAISSFVIATIIALALAGLATWLAYWYGRKSFDLTKQSFDGLAKQIESSEKSALDLNKTLFAQQLKLRNLDKELEIKSNIIERFRLSAESFIMQAENFLCHITLLHTRYIDHTFSEKTEVNSHDGEIFKNIQIKFDNLLNSRSRLLFSALEMDASTHDQIDEMTSDVINSLLGLQNKLVREREKIIEDIEKSKNMLFQIKIKLHLILKN